MNRSHALHETSRPSDFSDGQSLEMMFGRMLGHMDGISDATAELKSDMEEVKDRLRDGAQWMAGHTQRMNDFESRLQAFERRWARRLKHLLTLLREVASLKEWAVGAAVIVLALTGALQPGEIKAWILAKLDMPAEHVETTVPASPLRATP